MGRDYDIAVYGLGVMGRSLVHNMVNNGFHVCVYSKDETERRSFSGNTFVKVCSSEREMLAALRPPRRIFLMITAGYPVDQVMHNLLPALTPGDVLMDGGNSHYEDTNRRYQICRERKVHYLGVGVSGGEQGARFGASIMAGGSREGYRICEEILSACAAVSGGRRCCAWVGPAGAGHYVKMVHNGIEYGMLQMIAEIYHFMKQALGLSHDESTAIFESWKDTGLNSYLIDISVKVLKRKEEDGTVLVDHILDAAGQKGTGRWTVEEGIRRGIYLPTIYEAVAARGFSVRLPVRRTGNQILGTGCDRVHMEQPERVLADALELGMILCYSQGLELIQKASDDLKWQIDQPLLMDIWSEGCIIRSAMLKRIQKSLNSEEPFIFDSEFAGIKDLAVSLRKCVSQAVSAGLALPGLAGALHYYEYYRMETMPVGFIQALRDCFGAHTYKRNDREGVFHTQWEEREKEDECI